MKKCLLALALLFAVLLSGCAIVQTTDLADYGNTGGETWHGSAVFDLLSNLTSTGDADGTQSAAPPRMQELFPIFPPDALLQRAQDRDYHHLYRYTLLQDELFTRLSCRYSAADYQAEVEELLQARPQLRGQALPDAVSRAAVEGDKRLLLAYLDYEAQQAQAENERLRKENEIYKQNAATAARSPVRGVSGGGATDLKPSDPFLDGFNSSDW